MPYLTKKTYALDRPVLYNLANTNHINNIYIQPASLSMVGGCKKILAGSWASRDSNGARLLDRAIAVSDYIAGETKVVINNPWAFLPGDVLHIIGTDEEDTILEKNGVQQGTAPVFGTVDSVDAGAEHFSVSIAPVSAVINEVFSLEIEETRVSFIATTTNIEDVVKGLYDALVTDRQVSHHSSLDTLAVTDNTTTLDLKAKELGQIYLIRGSTNLNITVAKNIGTLNITPGSGNANILVGAKLGSINKPGIGIFAHTMYVTDLEDQERVADNAPYDAGNILKKSLPYLDGDLVASNQTLKYLPAYGIV